jgi:hypothetical protein
MTRTVKVKVAMSVDRTGHWMRMAAHPCQTEALWNSSRQVDENGERTYWLT